ncbi:MAG: helix-turn-helix domain-containing protein [Gaiellaceae bacterium]
MEQDVIERHYKTTELAELLGLHPETIRRAAQRGQLESIRIGLDRIYSESAIQGWLEANRDRAGLVSLGPTRETRSSTNRSEAR